MSLSLSHSFHVTTIDTGELLRYLVELYGERVGPVLLAIGKVESRNGTFNPDSVGDGGISRGAFQVNSEVWGAAAAPLGRETGFDQQLDQVKAQARAMRVVVDDATAAADSIASRTGAPFASAFNLVWQWGAPRAHQLAGDLAWSVDSISRRIAMLKDDAAAAAWRARDRAFSEAYHLALAALTAAAKTVAVGGAGAAILILLVLIFLQDKNRRRATYRYARAGARLL